MSKKVIKHVYPRKLGRALARTVLKGSRYQHVNKLLSKNWKQAAAHGIEAFAKR